MSTLLAFSLAFLLGFATLPWRSQSFTLSSRLVHRFSDEVRESRSMGGAAWGWPTKGSMEYYRTLVESDLLRRKKREVPPKFQTLFPSSGSETLSLGNDFGWLHYTWIDIGTPKVSFLVALDAGSDLSWVPCDCIRCAPLSSERNNLDKDLNMYSPAHSSTSMVVSCNHELCALGSSCKTPKQPCPYHISYYSENTSSLGLLVEDVLHLAASDNHAMVKAPVIFGCGRKQSGGYLDGIAPDGLLGLGLGDISVPTFLAKEGLVPNSFSMCFRDDDSGRILFGDKGVSAQQSTPFMTMNGKYVTYIVEVERFCIGEQCLKETRVKALIDSGSSFTYIPRDVYKKVSTKFNEQMNHSRFVYEGAPWEFCYKASSLKLPKIPQVTLMLAVNKSLTVNNPVFLYYGKKGELDGFCLALQSSTDTLAIVGQNLMTGYRMVFDREKLKLGWSRSDCNDLQNSRSIPMTPRGKPENPLPTNEQQSSPNSHAVSPAEAGRAPTKPSPASRHVLHFGFLMLLLFLVSFSIIFGG